MQKYVLGFMFDSKLENVVLIRKNKPDWQKGKLNGVGGKVEPLEDDPDYMERPEDAMYREFKEETGVFVSCLWKEFCLLRSIDFEIWCFYAVDQKSFDEAKTTESEEVVKTAVNDIKNGVDNLQWLVLMARNHAELCSVTNQSRYNRIFATVEYIKN